MPFNWGQVVSRDMLSAAWKRTDGRFALLMGVQWLAAVCVALWWAPHTVLGSGISRSTLVASAVLGGAAITLLPVAMVTMRAGTRSTRILIAVCQMLMSSLLIHLSGGQVDTRLHVFSSLALLAFYADWAVLAAASLAAIATQALTSSHHLSLTHFAQQVAWLAGCNVFLLWSARERIREARQLQERTNSQNDLLHRAFHDHITGLPNRAALEARLDAALEQSLPFTCMYMEVDGFRSANDLLGRRGADAFLCAIAASVRAILDKADIFARFSGDKFVLLVDRVHDRKEIAALAGAVVRAVSRPHTVEGRSLAAAVSIGIVHQSQGKTDRDTLLTAADRAMLAAKREGRNTYRYAEDLHEETEERSRLLAAKLQRAMMEGTLKLVYQPIFENGEHMVAAEALARWRDPDEGMISPAEFIPVAENTGLIVPLSVWVLREACRQMAQWVASGTALQRVAVNVSVMQVWRDDFVQTVEHTLLETGLAPARLELEVTESALANDFDTVKRHLQALRKLGVRISIDDFGTGYSSLSRVRELDADTLKVDKSFVQGASETPNGIAVVQAIIDMAHTLHMSVVAEGVETLEQLKMLRAMRCDEMQGFLLAKPQTPEALAATMARMQEPKHDRLLMLVPRPA